MMKADGGCTGVERAGVGADDALAKTGDLQALVFEIFFDKLGHGPIEEDGACFAVAGETVFNLLTGGRFADPEIVGPCARAGCVRGGRGTDAVAEAVDHIAHSAPAFNVAGGKG